MILTVFLVPGVFLMFYNIGKWFRGGKEKDYDKVDILDIRKEELRRQEIKELKEKLN